MWDLVGHPEDRFSQTRLNCKPQSHIDTCETHNSDSDMGIDMWLGSGRPSEVDGFPGFLGYLHYVKLTPAHLRTRLKVP